MAETLGFCPVISSDAAGRCARKATISGFLARKSRSTAPRIVPHPRGIDRFGAACEFDFRDEFAADSPLQRRVCELSVPLCGNPVRVRAPSLHRHYPVSAVLPPSAEARRTCASSSATRSRKAALFSMSPCVRSGSNVCQAAASRGWPASSERRKNAALGNFLLRPAAVPVERDGVPIQPRRLCPFASLDFTEREMPAQMPIEKAVARIAGEPRGWGGVGAASSSPLS